MATLSTISTETTPTLTKINLDPSPKSKSKSKSTSTSTATTNSPATIPPTLQKSLHRISLHPTLTPYRRRVYRVLLSVPPGRWTTYSALATYLDSSARAVGNAMRTNPFAPEVPCHRVLAANGSLGGYKGEWRVSKHVAGGGFQEEKKVRLKEEGVEFDGAGKAEGTCFREFRDLGLRGKGEVL
ncbi:methylated-DNA-protein-cysteine methyltransferase [Penicillium brasilianum]|uniref:Methylated-DNA--protein-cysteine methyltransferase n=1 Tax=Penicillium brasilianum TaxID=104259 RepID=A0A1S9RHZ2_PENBI|nr:methylated-DNA-protein-cysteine methyltransferase [Penicillium brasilianum]